jgi:hypothetical protein
VRVLPRGQGGVREAARTVLHVTLHPVACASDPTLRRPVPDLDCLAAGTHIAEMPGFRDPD